MFTTTTTTKPARRVRVGEAIAVGSDLAPVFATVEAITLDAGAIRFDINEGDEVFGGRYTVTRAAGEEVPYRRR